MGLHFGYDYAKGRKLTPALPRHWFVYFTDPKTGVKDRYEYVTEEDADCEAEKLRADGYDVTVIHLNEVLAKRKGG